MGRLTRTASLSLLGIVESQSQRLSRLVENILTAANLEAGVVRPKLDEVDVAALANETAADFAAEADLKLAGPDRCVALADGGHVRQVLVNFVGNALKYGAPPYAIRWGRRRRRCRGAEDCGPGVPEISCRSRSTSSPRPAAATRGRRAAPASACRS